MRHSSRSHTRDRLLARLLYAWMLLRTSATAENWPQWRGPAFNGSTTQTDLPAVWSETINKAWEVPLPGPGFSTPIVWDDHIYLSSVEQDTKGLLALCLSAADGATLWRHSTGSDRDYPRNHMATPSPVTDGQRVFFLFGTGQLYAFRADGNPLWKRDLVADYGPFCIQFGYSSSPLLWDDLIIIQVLQNRTPNRWGRTPTDHPGPVDSFLLGLRADTGQTLWRNVRPNAARDESSEAYSTPIPFLHPQSPPQFLVLGGNALTGHDPASGRELWRWGGVNPRDERLWRLVPSPLPWNDLVFVAAPKHDPFFAIRIPAAESLGSSNPSVEWSAEDFTPDASTPLLYQERLYCLHDDRRVVCCRDPRTGRVLWSGDLDFGAPIRAALTGADGKIYCMSERGEVAVLEAGDAFRILHTMDMGGRPACSSPVAAAGGVLFRTAERLVFIRRQS